MADDIFTIPTEIVARLRFESARCKAWNARWGEILTDFYAEAADEIERLRNLSGEVLESLNEMVDIEMLTVITPRLRDSAQALEKAVRGD